jgi:hypothetical protein
MDIPFINGIIGSNGRSSQNVTPGNDGGRCDCRRGVVEDNKEKKAKVKVAPAPTQVSSASLLTKAAERPVEVSAALSSVVAAESLAEVAMLPAAESGNAPKDTAVQRVSSSRRCNDAWAQGQGAMELSLSPINATYL